MSRESWEERRDDQAVVARPFCTTLPRPDPKLWTRFRMYLEGRGLSCTLAKANGWYPSSYDGEARVVIPATASEPTNRYWQARSMENATTLRYDSPHSPRGDALIVVWPSSTPRAAVIAEGPMDALAAAGEGVLGVGLMGLAPPPAALEFALKMVSKLRLAVVADEDAWEAATSLVLWFYGRRKEKTMIRSVRPWKDLAEVPVKYRRKVLQ